MTAASSCGDVKLVPAPFTPQDVTVIYSQQEDISVIRWRVSSTEPLPDTTFDLDGAGGYAPIDFSTSVFAGGVNRCGDKTGSCAQFIVRGVYSIEDHPHPVRARRADFGVLPGGPATASTAAQTLSVDGFFHPHNDVVYVSVTDAVAASGPFVFPRPYDRALWPTDGLCVSDSPPAGVSFSPLDATSGFPPDLPLSDSGIYCLAARPVPADGGDATMVQNRIETVPEVQTAAAAYTPPVELSPVIYQIILDLEIPVADRCTSAIATIQSLVAEHMTALGVMTYQLPTMNLAAADDSSACAQVDGRSLPAADMAQAVTDLITTLPGPHEQFHLLYFNNLDAPLPDTLTQSFDTLFADLAPPPPYQFQLISWLFNPGTAAVSNVAWTMMTPWIAADDPMFEQALASYQPQLPYTTQDQEYGDPVPLLSDADTATYAGDFVKICSSSPPVTPVAGTMPTISTADPPSYSVQLGSPQPVAADAFVSVSANVNYQICTRYCDGHGYITDAGAGVQSWEASPLCASKDY